MIPMRTKIVNIGFFENNVAKKLWEMIPYSNAIKKTILNGTAIQPYPSFSVMEKLDTQLESLNAAIFKNIVEQILHYQYEKYRILNIDG